jgi:hypothetical protein
MFGEGTVCLGTAVVTWSLTNVKSSPKMVWSSRTLLPTCSAAGVHSMVPDGLVNCTAR